MASHDGHRSRRTFLKAALLGATSVVVGAPVRMAEAKCVPGDPGCNPPPPPYQEVFAGNVTLGALLTAYVPAPLTATGQMQWTITNTRTDTRSFTDEAGTTMKLSSSISLGPISIGTELKESASTKVTNAVAISLTESQTIATGVPAGGGAAIIDNTGFLLLANPVLAIYNIYRYGTLSSQRAYALSGSGTIAAWSLSDLRDDPAKRGLVGPATADNILAQYPLSSGVTSGANAGITAPRFAKLFELSLGQAPYSFVRSVVGSSQVTTSQSKSISTDVHAGFLGFGAGKEVTVTYSSVQQVDNTTTTTVQGTLTSTLDHLIGVYTDGLFNTLLMTDDGPLAAHAAVVEGTVTATDGSPVAGAVVTLSANGISFVAVSGPDGRYAIRTSTALRSGAHTVRCAGMSRTAILGAAPARIDYAGVDRELARATAG